MALLELLGISQEVPGVRALDRVSFDLEKGEVHALCGENGAGKSTLIKVLSGFYPHGSYDGQLRLRGAAARFAGIPEAERAGIGVIAQELALVPEMSVAENVMLGREPVARGLIRWDRLRASARAALALVGSDADAEAPVRRLGVGSRQMVEIAKALDKRSEILVLDEPTAALTEADARRLLALVDGLRARGVSSIYISHRLDEVFAIADRITVLRDGRRVATAPTGEWTPERVIAAMVGRERTHFDARPRGSPGKTALAVEDWRVADPDNPGRCVLDGVCLEARAGGGDAGRGPADPDAVALGPLRRPLRGHAAEGGPRQVAARAAARVLLRRADPGDRRGLQGGDPRHPRTAGRGGRRDRARLLGPVGAALPLRPRARSLEGAADGHAFRPSRDARGRHGRRDVRRLNVAQRKRPISWQALTLIGALAVLWAVFLVTTLGTFVSPRYLTLLARQMSVTSLLAVGYCTVILT